MAGGAQQNIKQQAQQGNVDALATLIGTVLDLQKTVIRVKVHRSSLQIDLESPYITDQKRISRLITQEVAALDLQGIRQVSISSWTIKPHSGKSSKSPAWSHRSTLSSAMARTETADLTQNSPVVRERTDQVARKKTYSQVGSPKRSSWSAPPPYTAGWQRYLAIARVYWNRSRSKFFNPLTVVMVLLFLFFAPKIIYISVPEQPIWKAGSAKLMMTTTEEGRTLTSEQIYARVSPAVVRIDDYQGIGTGIILTANGVVLTNAHVVRNHTVGVSLNSVVNGNRKLKGVVIVDDEMSDLALVQIEDVQHLPTVTWTTYKEKADSDQDELALASSRPVYAIGYPRGKKTMTTGKLISVPTASFFRYRIPIHALTTEPGLVTPGFSGGPLINADGRVIGVTYATIGTGEGLHLSSVIVKHFLDDVVPRAEIERDKP
jgi:S1-C subfamily serine protease